MPPKAVNKRGAPTYKPTDMERAQVKTMCATGITQGLIARCMSNGKGIDEKTLRKHFRDELDTSRAMAIANMGKGVYERGINGSTTDAIFYLKTQGGWKETNVTEHTGKDGGVLMWGCVKDE